MLGLQDVEGMSGEQQGSALQSFPKSPKVSEAPPPGTAATATSSAIAKPFLRLLSKFTWVALGTRPTEQPRCLNPANTLLPSLSMLLETLGNKASLTWNEKQLHVVLASTPVHLHQQEKTPSPFRANPWKGTAFPANLYSRRNSLPTQFLTIQQPRQMVSNL